MGRQLAAPRLSARVVALLFAEIHTRPKQRKKANSTSLPRSAWPGCCRSAAHRIPQPGVIGTGQLLIHCDPALALVPAALRGSLVAA